MAIAFDHAVNLGSSSTGTTLTAAFTVTVASNNILFVGATGDNVAGNATDDITGVTYAGTSMTLINKVSVAADRFRYLFYLANPATGTNNVVITSSTNNGFKAGAISQYTGAAQTGIPDSQNTNSATANTLTTSTTVIASNCWLVMYSGVGGATATAGTGATLRDIANNGGIFDSNGTVGTGSQSMTITTSDSPTTHPIMSAMASFAPPGAVVTTVPLRALLGVGL